MIWGLSCMPSSISYELKRAFKREPGRLRKTFDWLHMTEVFLRGNFCIQAPDSCRIFAELTVHRGASSFSTSSNLSQFLLLEYIYRNGSDGTVVERYHQGLPHQDEPGFHCCTSLVGFYSTSVPSTVGKIMTLRASRRKQPHQTVHGINFTENYEPQP